VWKDEGHIIWNCADSGRASKGTGCGKLATNGKTRRISLGRSVWWTACWSASCKGFGVAFGLTVHSTDLCY
jgi:hypothetical protein